MNPLQKNLLCSAIGAALALGAAGSVRADAFAQSILAVDNFRLLHPNGTPYTAFDFAMLSGTSDTHVTGQLNGQFSGGTRWDEFGNGAALDVAHSHVGAELPAHAENSFQPSAGSPGAPASFGYADARMDGAVITTTLGPAGALAQTRADASLTASGAASGNAALASAASFSFSLGTNETMTIAFSARPFAQAYVGEGAGAGTSAATGMTWSISVLDLTTGATVFAFQPEQLNALGSVSRGDGFDGATIYAPGTLSFAATTGMLDAGTFYQVTITQSTMANALQAQQVQQMPEPATLAGLGAGLLAMATLARRRRQTAASRNF
jgi:hypothetical protein